MRKTGILGIILVLLLLSFVNLTSAENIISSDKAEWYRKGQICMELENYADAVEAFTQAGDYEQSKTLLVYCRGMLLLQKANELEVQGFLSEMTEYLNKAEDYFELLSGIEFEDSKALLQYTQARIYEAKGLTQKALDMYSTLMGVFDSNERYLRLKDGIVIRPVTTPDPTQNTLVLISAQAYKSTNTYDGPGTSYSKNAIVVTPDMPVRIAGQRGEWYLIDTVQGGFPVRVWVPKIRVMRNDSIEPYSFDSDSNAKINRPTEIYYGPGLNYIFTGVTLQPGTPVTAFAEDGAFTLIEFVNEVNQLPMCGWVNNTDLTKR